GGRCPARDRADALARARNWPGSAAASPYRTYLCASRGSGRCAASPGDGEPHGRGRGMKLVVLGLTLSSSWGNGHATTYRALLQAFAKRGHDILFLERDVPWYRNNRDIADANYCRLEYYGSLEELDWRREEIRCADAVIVGSYVPDGVEV